MWDWIIFIPMIYKMSQDPFFISSNTLILRAGSKTIINDLLFVIWQCWGGKNKNQPGIVKWFIGIIYFSFLPFSLNSKPEIWQPSRNPKKEQKPRTKSPGQSFLPQTRAATPREIKITPSSKNGTKMVKNFIRIILSFIALSMVSTKSTQPGSADY